MAFPSGRRYDNLSRLARSPGVLTGLLNPSSVRVDIAVWGRLLPAILLLLAGGAWGLQGVLQSTHGSWSDIYGHFAHGYLILVMSAWLAVRMWPRSGPVAIAPAWWMLIPLAGAVAGLVLLETMFVDSGRQVLLPPIVLCAVFLVLGAGIGRKLIWPVLFLYFALSQWWVINGALKSLTTFVVNRLVSLSGIPAYIDGSHFLLPAGTVEIAYGCSGLNYLVVGLALACFQALLYLRTWRSRILLCAVSVAVALVSNWIRVFALILIAYATDMQHYLIRVDHLYFGWALFMVLMWPVLIFGSRLEAREGGVSHAPVGGGGYSVSTAVVPAAAVAAALLVVPGLVVLASGKDSVAAIPLQADAFAVSVSADRTLEWHPSFVGAQQERLSVQWRGRTVEVFRAGYPVQTYAGRVTNRDNNLLGRNWREGASSTGMTTVAGEPLEYTEYEGWMQGSPVVVLRWFEIGGRVANSSLEAKIASSTGIILGRPEAAVIALARPCVPDCGAAREDLLAFVQAARESLRFRVARSSGPP